MVILFVVISLRTPPTPWGDVSQALIYHQVSKPSIAHSVTGARKRDNKGLIACDVMMAMLVVWNNKIFLLWKLTSIFMQTM